MNESVVIVGGGVVGLLLALALVNQSIPVILIEKQNHAFSANEEKDHRSIALSALSVNFLENLGVWSELVRLTEKIHHIHVSEKGGFGQFSLHANEENIEFFGVVIALSALKTVLLSHLKKSTFIDFRSGTSVEAIANVGSQYELILTNVAGQYSLTSSLIIAADGVNSVFKSQMDCRPYHYDYQQSALVFDIELRHSHQGWAYERFTGNGVMALLPVGVKKMSVIWTKSPSFIEMFKALSKYRQLLLVQKTFGYRLGQFECIAGDLDEFPLQLSYSRSLTSKNVLLFGNAAHSLHPISGQGMNLSIRDIGALNDILRASWSKISVEAMLQQYEQQRKWDHKRTIAMTHNLIQLFITPLPSIKMARRFGLGWLMGEPVAKHFIHVLMMGKVHVGSTLLGKGRMQYEV